MPDIEVRLAALEARASSRPSTVAPPLERETETAGDPLPPWTADRGPDLRAHTLWPDAPDPGGGLLLRALMMPVS